MHSFWLKAILPFLALQVASAACAEQHSGTRVDVALVLAIDASSSISSEEFAFQLAATARALSSDEVMAAIQRNDLRKIAVNYLIWGDPDFSPHRGDWRIVTTRGDALAFAAAIASRKRRVMGDTGVGHAILEAIAMLDRCPCTPARKVIDVSGDGKENTNLARHDRKPTVVSATDGRMEAERQGITVNGLAIQNEQPDLADWYRRNIQTGIGSFVVNADDWPDFESTIRRKLVKEITNTAISERQHKVGSWLASFQTVASFAAPRNP